MNKHELGEEKIAVIGSGTMGAGIAQVCLQAGFYIIFMLLRQPITIT